MTYDAVLHGASAIIFAMSSPYATLAPVYSPIQSAKSQSTLTRQMCAALYEDSGSWSFNRLEPGSCSSSIKVDSRTSGDNIGLPRYRVYFKYSDGSRGWMEAEIEQGQIRCIAYQDSWLVECNIPRTDAGRAMGRAEQRMRDQARKSTEGAEACQSGQYSRC